MKHSWRLLLICLGLFAFLMPVPATALVHNADITHSWCNNPDSDYLDWRGNLDPHGPPDGAFGSTRFCQKRYKIDDKDSDFDYFAVELTLRFKQEGWDAYSGGRAKVTLNSNRAARQNVYDATGDKRSTKCKEVSVGFNWGYVGGALPFRICDSAMVDRVRLDTTGAAWTAANISKSKVWTVVYTQKVPQGSRPTFGGTLRWPYYKWNKPDANHAGWWDVEGYGSMTWCLGPKTAACANLA